MDTKKVMIYVDLTDAAKRGQVERGVTRVLASYPHAVLAEVTAKQQKSLEAQGYHLEVQEGTRFIRLQSVVLDTTVALPQVPAVFALQPTERSRRKRDYWIVHFVGPVKTEWLDAVRALGGVVKHYIPENAFLVSLDRDKDSQVRGLEGVDWVGPYEAAYKISPLLMGRKTPLVPADLGMAVVDSALVKPSGLGNLTIVLHDPASMRKVSAQVEKIGGSVINKGGNSLTISLEPEKVAEVAKLAEVEWIEPYGLPRLHNDVASQIMNVQNVRNTHGLDGDGQIVGVADTGLDTGVNDASMHDDFQGRIVSIHSWPVQDGFKPMMNNTSWDDGAADLDSGHGTHTSGSVLGNGSCSNGGICGTAPAARLVFMAVEQYCNMKPAYGSSGYYLVGIPADLNTLFQQAYNDGARIQSDSWGGDQDSSGNPIYGHYTAESQDIDEFVWNHKDMILLFSAGNSGIDSNHDGLIEADSLGVEATAKNCITVGASENNRPSGSTPAPGFNGTYGNGWSSDFPTAPISTDHVSNNPQGMAAFSSRGPCDDSRIKPDVVAPGTNVLSVRSSQATGTGWGLLPAADPRRPFYMFDGGTSMSTPLTAGTAALIRQYLMRVCLHTPNAALVKAILIHGATPMTGQYAAPKNDVGTPPERNQGWGRVDLENALFPASPVYWQFKDNPADAVGTSEHRDYTVQVTNGSVPFRATLVYSDYYSSPSTGGLVNQLSLSVTRPNGTMVQGAPTGNNVQQVVINNPATGAYIVRVTGSNVPTQASLGQKQDFAVVFSGGLEYVELYIKDNAADTGVAPSVGLMYQSPDIWVSLSNDPLATAIDNPEYGQTNYVFVKVHNRGSKAGINAQVKLYWANPGTNLSRPFWQTSGITGNGVAGNITSVSVPAHSGAVDGQAVAVFEWQPPDPATDTAEPGHFCLFASVDHPEDPLLMEDIDQVQWEDNLAWKNYIVLDGTANSTTTMEFHVAGLAGAGSIGSLHIDRSALPQGGDAFLKIPARYLTGGTAHNLNNVWQSEGGRVCRVQVTAATGDLDGFHLDSNENSLVVLEVKMPPTAPDGSIFPVFVDQRVNGAIRGRVTLAARFKGTPAFLANRASLEIHLSNCFWAKKISRHHVVPYEDLDLAIQRGYNGCRFCLPDYSTD